MRIAFLHAPMLAALAIILSMADPSHGKEISHEEFSASVDSLLASEIIPDAPGAAIAVIQHGKSIYRRCFGLASLEHTVPITNETVFNLASVTKQFTALAVLLLEQEGKLSLDDDIHKYFPELPAYDATVTLRNLMHHTSGLWEYSTMFRYYGGHNPVDYTSIEDVLTLLKGQDQLIFAPGSQWVYCNTNYALLGELIARVTGESLASWAQKSIFEPLEMKHTLFPDDCFQVIPNAADCYYKNDDVYYKDPRNSDVVGEGYLYSTIDDMILWLDNFRQRKVGGDMLIERMFQTSMLNDGSECFYGYGLGVKERNGKLVVSHSGQTGSFISMVIYAPEDEFGIVILSNSRHLRAEPLGYRILDLFYPTDKEEIAETPASEPKPFITIDSANIESLGGGYLIDENKGRLLLCRLGTGFYGIMDGYGSDLFRPISESLLANNLRNAFIHIQDEGDRKVARIMLDLKKSGNIMWASRIDAPVLTSKQLTADYGGKYYSDALGIAYNVIVDDNKLVIQHHRYSDRPLQMTDKDEFVGSIGIVRFSRNEKGLVESLAISDEDTNFKPFTFKRM
ncbi:MAG: beta-lactamase family protein [candidate division Zixibacteria bacterium]|nr:beta-lactamase family protein [candidate division Zixibacteria bacterium]